MYSHIFSLSGSTMPGMTSLQGVLSTLSSLFKHAKRDDVVEFAPTVLEHVSKCNLTDSDNTLLRKLSIKLVQVLAIHVYVFYNKVMVSIE